MQKAFLPMPVVAALAAVAALWTVEAGAQERLRPEECTRELARSAFETVDAGNTAAQQRIADGCLAVSRTARGIEAARARFYAGRAYGRMGNADEAIRQLEVAVNSGRDYLPAFGRELRAGLLELSQAYRTVGRIDDARRLLRTPTLSPSDPAVALQLGLLTLRELGPAGQESAFESLKNVFTGDDALLRGTIANPTYVSAEEIRRGRSWLVRLGVSLGQEALRQQGRNAQERRDDAQRALDFLVPAAAAVNAACPSSAPIDCGGIGATEQIGALEAQGPPAGEQLLDVFFKIGVAHLKAAGLQESAGLSSLGGGMGGVGALDCVATSQLAPDAVRHFQDAEAAFNAYVVRSSASAAPSAYARWGLGCTILAKTANVADPFERQRQLALALDQLRAAPSQPLTMLTMARAQVLQGQFEPARASFRRALEMSGATTRCPPGQIDGRPGQRDALASRLYLEMARTRYAYDGATTAASSSAMFDRTIAQVAAARPASLRESEADLRCAIYLDGDNVEARLALGHTYLRLGFERDSGPALDPAPFRKAGEVLRYFETRQGGGTEGNAEGLYLLSQRLVRTQQMALVEKRSRGTNDRSFRSEGEQAVRFASQAFSLSQQPLYRRQTCQAQILFGQTAEQGACAASGEADERAESLLYEGMYWLRRGQRDARTKDRKTSWSQSIRSFSRGMEARREGQTVAVAIPGLPESLDLSALLSYGHRYVLGCNELNLGDTDSAPDAIKDFYWLSGMPLQCGGPPS